jgi:4-hydroxy-tetrahydrodipicolinate synthase
MSKNEKIRGIYPVAVTPFKEDGSFDVESAKSNVDHLIDSGIKGICILGATGEYMSVTNEEHKKYVEEIVPYISNRVSVIVGVTRERPEEVIELVKNAKKYGASAAMVLPPYYCHPGQDEIFEHFKYINDNVDLPIIVYNNPGSAGVEIEAETYDRILRLPNAQIVKESTGDMKVFTRLMLKEKDIVLLCGCDNMAYEYFKVGAVGWISMAANIAPKKCKAMFDLIESGEDDGRAKELYRDILPLLNILESVSYPVQAIKYLLNKKGLNGGYVRKPRIELNQEQKYYLDSNVEIDKLY